MRRKLTAIFLAAALVLAYGAPAALAAATSPEVIAINAEDIGIVPYASEDFSGYQASLNRTGNGGLDLYGRVIGKYVSSSIGIQSVTIYQYTNGRDSVAKTFGKSSTPNASNFNNSYTYKGTAGVEYYAEITFFITRANGTVVTTVVESNHVIA